MDKLIARAEEAPVVKLVDLIIRQAIDERASDIHIEPYKDKISLRYRIDGKLYQRQLVRVESGKALETVVRKLSRKYKIPATMEAVETGYLWVFEMTPPRQGA